MGKYTPEKLQEIYRKMLRIRFFEDQVTELFKAGEIPGFVHVYTGEEAVGVGVCDYLTKEDYITSTHRGHGHCIAKGCDVNGMMAEIYGKATGLNNGKGGSMHIADVDKGMLGANGMVSGGMPIAVGAGLRNKYLKTDDVAVCFFGDGANNEGNFHEAMNMASIWKLPVIFVNENNNFAEATPQIYATAAKTIAQRADAYDMPSERVDGKNFMAVFEAAGRAIDRARQGDGPTLIECKTYRNYGHFEGDQQTYKYDSPEEEAFAKRDDIQEFRAYAVSEGLFTAAEADQIEQQSTDDIEAAVKFAEDSPLPDPESLYEDVFAD